MRGSHAVFGLCTLLFGGSRHGGLFRSIVSFWNFHFRLPTHNFSPTQNSTQNSTIVAQNRAKNAPKNKAKTPRKRTKKVLGDAELAAKLLKKERQREAEVARVLKANAEHLKATRTSAPPVVAPRTKPFVTTNHLAHVRVGERVQVKANASPGYNRPAGNGYVQLVAGAGAETVVSVKQDAAHGVGCSTMTYRTTTSLSYYLVRNFSNQILLLGGQRGRHRWWMNRRWTLDLTGGIPFMICWKD